MLYLLLLPSQTNVKIWMSAFQGIEDDSIPKKNLDYLSQNNNSIGCTPPTPIIFLHCDNTHAHNTQQFMHDDSLTFFKCNIL